MRCGLAKAFPNECTSHLTAGVLELQVPFHCFPSDDHIIPIAAHEDDRSVKGGVAECQLAFQKTLGVPILPMEMILS